MAEVNTQIKSSKVGQVNGVGKVLGQKFDDGVWINFICNVTKPASFPFFQQGYHAKHTENTRMHNIKKNMLPSYPSNTSLSNGAFLSQTGQIQVVFLQQRKTHYSYSLE